MVVLKFVESIHTETLLTVRIVLALDIIIFSTPWVVHVAIHANMISSVRLKFKTISTQLLFFETFFYGLCINS